MDQTPTIETEIQAANAGDICVLRLNRPTALNAINSQMIAELEVTLTDGKRQVFFVNYSDGKKTVGPVNTDANVAVWDVTADGKSANFRKAKARKRSKKKPVRFSVRRDKSRWL